MDKQKIKLKSGDGDLILYELHIDTQIVSGISVSIVNLVFFYSFFIFLFFLIFLFHFLLLKFI